MNTFTPNTLFVRKPELIAAEMDGDIVLMSIEQGEYFGIGGIGPIVWALLAQPVSLSQMVDTVCAEYEISPEICNADITTFVSALLHNDLISRI